MDRALLLLLLHGVVGIGYGELRELRRVTCMEEEEGVLLTSPSGAALVGTPACWPGRRGEAACTGTRSRSSLHTGDHVPGCVLPSVSPHLPDPAWPYKWEHPGR